MGKTKYNTQQLTDMAVGQTLEFPHYLGNLRSTASYIGRKLGRKYTSHINRDTMTFTVTRIK